MVQFPVSLKALEKKREILKAASQVFRETGIHASGMREIADACGMTAGNLYYYFANKQAILAFCQQDSLDGLLALVRQVDQLTDNPAERLFALIVGHVILVNEATPGNLAHLEVEGLEDPWRQIILAHRDEYKNEVKRILQEGVDQGIFRRDSSAMATFFLLGALNWTVRWFDPGGSLSATDIGIQFAHHGLRTVLEPGAEWTPPSPSIIDRLLVAPDQCPLGLTQG